MKNPEASVQQNKEGYNIGMYAAENKLQIATIEALDGKQSKNESKAEELAKQKELAEAAKQKKLADDSDPMSKDLSSIEESLGL